MGLHVLVQLFCECIHECVSSDHPILDPCILASAGKCADGGLCVSGCFMHVFLSFHNAWESELRQSVFCLNINVPCFLTLHTRSYGVPELQ